MGKNRVRPPGARCYSAPGCGARLLTVRRDTGNVRSRTILGLLALAALVAACAPNASQSALEPAGPYAQKAHDLFVPVFWVAAVIFFLVEGFLLIFAIRYRHRKGRERIPAQVHGNTRLEV